MTRVLVTGATGFVGRTLCESLAAQGLVVRAALRVDQVLPQYVAEKVVVGDIDGATDWAAALGGIELVVHAAARAHLAQDAPENAQLYFATNAEGTRRLAEQAAHAGVRRLVYVSSVKVNGERCGQRGFGPLDRAAPQDVYGASKLQGENFIAEVCARSALGFAIVRPPLVYGPGVRANFLRLLGWVDAGWPLPFGAVRNRRSLVSVWNLCDLLLRVLLHPAASGRVWMVSDGEDFATPQLIRLIGAAMGRRVRLLPVPVALLRTGGRALGKSAEIDRLCGSLFVDIAETRLELGWQPPLSVAEGLARTVSWYRHARGPAATAG